MAELARKIEEARANLAALEQAAQHATCRELGHDWHSCGGANAGCGHPGCSCSVPVHECRRCGDCDYGDNEWAKKTRADCAARHADDEAHEEMARANRRASLDLATDAEG